MFFYQTFGLYLPSKYESKRVYQRQQINLFNVWQRHSDSNKGKRASAFRFVFSQSSWMREQRV